MKKISATALFTLPFLFAFTGNSIQGDDLGESGQKSPPSCYVNYVKPVKSLTAVESRVVFQFTSDYSGVVKDSVVMSYNGISKTLHCDSTGHAALLVKPGKYKFLFWLNNVHEEIYSDSINIKPANETGINVWFTNTYIIREADKPVIYFYPQATTNISVQLDVQGQLGFTYPTYNNGWQFAADPNGKLHCGGRDYDYIFWDAKIPFSAERPMLAEGFLVERDSLITFFEKNLTAMGLNAREQQDFITYWCPLMQKYEKCFVHFKFNEDYNDIAGITISPKPDNLFRVFMTWEDAGARDWSRIKPQTIQSVKREGFTVVEWGGSDLTGASCMQVEE